MINVQKILKNCGSDIASLARWLKVIAVLCCEGGVMTPVHVVRLKRSDFSDQYIQNYTWVFYSIFKCSCFRENNPELEFSLQLWRKLMQGWLEGKAHSWNLGRSHKYFGEINQNILMNSIKTFTYPIVKINETVAKNCVIIILLIQSEVVLLKVFDDNVCLQRW